MLHVSSVCNANLKQGTTTSTPASDAEQHGLQQLDAEVADVTGVLASANIATHIDLRYTNSCSDRNRGSIRMRTARTEAS